MLWAAVEAIEDTGYVLTFGADVQTKGFVKKEGMQSYLAAKGARLRLL